MTNDMHRQALLMLSDRPLEPIFTTRENGKAIFDIPNSFYADEYTEVQDDIMQRFSGDVDVKIPLRDLPVKPNLNFAKQLGLRRQFSLFQQLHQEIAAELISILLEPPSLEQFISTCAYSKDRVNPCLFQYCYAVALNHREDIKNAPIRPIAELFPNNFVEPAVLQQARKEAELVEDPGTRRRINIPLNYTASDLEEEQRLGYFREDIGVNSHHWHWHLVYPGMGPRVLIDKDRRGELFYHMHHQIVARYNIERLCNNLPKAKLLSNFNAPVKEGYFPKLLSSLSNRTYPSRVTDHTLKDVDRENLQVDIADIGRWIDRVVQSIDEGYVTDSTGKKILLDPIKGIDLLGNLIESSDLSVNPDFYGSIHNRGHTIISFAHDPDYRFLEDSNVMGDVTTAMRDPLFYRWHGYLDTIFNRHKMRLPPYNERDLGFNGITVQECTVMVTNEKAKPNTLLTFWQKSNVQLGAGLDFGPKGSVYATFTHLQHAPFQYNFQINNTTGMQKKGTLRIFLCPKKNERGTALTLNDVRLMCIEMDKMTVTLNPGMNIVTQLSTNSSVTIPYERTFRPIGEANQPTGYDEMATFRFCGCGWPQHMLVPRGKPEGMLFDLFAMVSDFAGDEVIQASNSPDVCGDASSLCGLKDKLYPDKRCIGYPFDKRLQHTTLAEMTSAYSNMIKTDVNIIFTDIVVERPKA